MTDHPVATRRPGGRSADVRSRVLAAVAALLAEQGVAGLSVDAVAERAGVHRTSVYRRWRDVGGLLADSFGTDDDWTPPDTGTLLGDLTALNREVFDGLTARPAVVPALIAASFHHPRAAAALTAFWQDRYRRCAVVVTRAVARGEAPPGTDPHRVLVAASAPLYHRVVLLRETVPPGLAEQSAVDAVAMLTG
jgi:AcrR family transcriptional regulator